VTGCRTDKHTLGYYPACAELARRIGPAGRVLEVGVAYGGSLEMWQDLFPAGLVAGADQDPSCHWPDGTVRIVAAQESEDLADMARLASPQGWDLIVDDASHNGILSEVTFRMLWPLVKPGGWYVLEDWAVGYLPGYALGDSMLKLAESFLRMLEPAPGATDLGGHQIGRTGSQLAEAWYRFGQAMLHKQEAP
jgi:hypothetical protein